MSTLERDSIAVEKAEYVFQRWRAESTPVWDAPDADFKAYMDAFSSMQSLHDKTSGEGLPPSVKALHESAKRLLLAETPKLEEGLLHVLLPYNTPPAPEKVYEAFKAAVAQAKASCVQEADVPVEERGVCFIPESALWRLHLIVKLMVRRRLIKRCTRIVKNSRRTTLMESLRLLARQRFNPKHVPSLSWEDLQNRVEQWRQFVKVAVLVLLASERRVCERMFNLAGLSEFCFAEISMGSEKLLFEFVEAFASSKKSPERLFPLLESYETLIDLQPSFNEIFAGSGPCKSLRNELTVTMSRVGVAVRGVFSEFEKHIEKEPSRPPNNASVHALTNYVVNYLNCLYAYTDTLTKLYTNTGNVVIAVPKLMRAQEDDDEEGDEFVEEFVEEEQGSSGGGDEDTQEFWGEPRPEYLEACALISRKLECLELALKEKAKAHIKEPEKQHFFLMNNIHYMARKVKENDLRRILGDDWIRDAAERVQENANEYMRLTWNKLTAILKEEQPSSGGGLQNLFKSAGKDKLVKFCQAMDEVYKAQFGWIANKPFLQSELEQAVKRRIVPLYSDFFERHVGPVEKSKAPPKNIKHPSYVNEMLNQLYQGPQPS